MADTQTYGPAVTRRGRTPIQFRPLDQGSGQFQGTPDIQSLLKNPSLIAQALLGKNRGTINIDPSASENQVPGGMGNTIRHEDIHSILYPLGDSASANQSPGYLDIARALSGRSGNTAFEAPAYVGSGDNSPIKVDPLIKQAFWKGYVDHINSLDPKVGKQLQAFGPGTPPAGFEFQPTGN